MATNYHQLSLKDTFSDCNDMFMDDVPSFFQLLDQHFDISPTCPNDSSLAMKYCGVTHEKRRTDRTKWICPKVHMVKGTYVCDCGNPCSTATKGRTTYTYENLDFRMFPGIQRDSAERDSLYKIRTIVERAIDHLKINMCVAGRKSRNRTTTKSRCFSCRDRQPAYRHCRPQHELSTIHPKSETFNCLKKHSIVIVHLKVYKSTPQL